MAARTVIRRDLNDSCLRESRLGPGDRPLVDQPDNHESRPGDHSSGVPGFVALRDHGATRGDLVRNEQTPHPSSGAQVPLTFSSVLWPLGNHHYGARHATLRRHGDTDASKRASCRRAGSPWKTPRRPAERRNSPRRPCGQALCLAGGPPRTELATALFGVRRGLHLQQPPAQPSSDRPRWLLHTPSVTQISSLRRHGRYLRVVT